MQIIVDVRKVLAVKLDPLALITLRKEFIDLAFLTTARYIYSCCSTNET